MFSLPPEIWIRVLTFLPDSEVVRLYGVDLLFYDVALARRYGHLSLADYAAFERTKACVRLVTKHSKIFVFSNQISVPLACKNTSRQRASSTFSLILKPCLQS